jgi:phosphoesterase RecJ-like protein
MIYSGLRFYRDGRLVFALVTQDMIRRSGAGKDDYDDLASLAGRAESSVLNITIREQEDGSSRVSVRSNPGISSSDICAAFGGGGHEMAAGCNIACPPEKARDMLLDVIEELVP